MSAAAKTRAGDESDSDHEEVVQEETPVAEEEAPEDTTLANSDVTTKYQEAAKIVQACLQELEKLVSLVNCALRDHVLSDKISFSACLGQKSSICAHLVTNLWKINSLLFSVERTSKISRLRKELHSPHAFQSMNVSATCLRSRLRKM